MNKRTIITMATMAGLGVIVPTASTMASAATTPTTHAAVASAEQSASTFPMKITNNAGKGTVHFSAIGQINGGKFGHLDLAGNLIPFPEATSKAAQDVADPTAATIAPGASVTINLPDGFSGRFYYGFGQAVPFQVVIDGDGKTGVVQPVPWDKSGKAFGLDYDTSEMTYTGSNLWLNSTQVDFIANPSAISATGDEGTLTTGGIEAGGVSKIAAALSKIDGFSDSTQYDSNGKILRVLAPAHLVDTSAKRSTYLDPYINRVWSKYSNETLKIQPDPTNHPELTFTGKVVDGKMVFSRDGDANSPKIAVNKPTTSDVWGCDGALVAGQEKFQAAPYINDRGMIARSLCADFHRGVLGTQSISPSTNGASYYQVNSMNGGLLDWYSKAVHDVIPGGKAYGFAFDDVGGRESLVHSTSPKSATIELLNVINGGGGSTTTPTTPTTPTTGGNTTTPTTPTTPTTGGSTTTPTASDSASTNVTVPSGYPGYMTLNLPSGTTAGALDVMVDGKKVSSISVGGAGSVRADVPTSAGNHVVTVKSSTGSVIGSGFTVTVPGGTTSTPTTGGSTTTPTTGGNTTTSATTRTVDATFTATSPGWANLSLGAGTKAGVVTVKIDGGSTSTVAVDGAGTVRVDAKASAGTHKVTVSSTADLGDVKLTPGS